MSARTAGVNRLTHPSALENYSCFDFFFIGLIYHIFHPAGLVRRDEPEPHAPCDDRVNQPIGDWDSSSVTSLSHTTQKPIGDWDRHSVTSLIDVIHAMTAFNQPTNLWDASSDTRTSWHIAVRSFTRARVRFQSSRDAWHWVTRACDHRFLHVSQLAR